MTCQASLTGTCQYKRKFIHFAEKYSKVDKKSLKVKLILKLKFGFESREVCGGS